MNIKYIKKYNKLIDDINKLVSFVENKEWVNINRSELWTMEYIY